MTAMVAEVYPSQAGHGAVIATWTQIVPPPPRTPTTEDRIDTVCTICGTGAETGPMFDRWSGWPAHSTCVDWRLRVRL